MPTPDYLRSCTDDIVELMDILADSIVQDMARRIVKIGVTDSSLWQMQKLKEAGKLQKDVIASISKMSGKTQTQLKALFKDATAKATSADKATFKKAGLDTSPLSLLSPAVKQTLAAGLQKTGGVLRNLTMSTAVTSQAAFGRHLDLAYLQVTSGAMSYTQAIRQAIKRLADEGITTIDYASGRQDKIDVAARRAALAGVAQTTAKVQLANMDAMGCDLVETTAHAEARPEHQVWQGKVFSRSGKSARYPPFEASTGIGTVDGLCGAGCRHGFHTFIEGVSEMAYTVQELAEIDNRTVEYNGQPIKLYYATQMQRRMERGIRQTKRELVAYNAGMEVADPEIKEALQEQFVQDSIRLKKQEARLKDFEKQTGLPNQSERLQVIGFGRSEAQKAVWASKKAENSPPAASTPDLHNSSEQGIIKSDPIEPLTFSAHDDISAHFGAREKAWAEALTDAERSTVYDYTDATQLSINANNALRQGTELTPKQREFTDNLSCALGKWTVAEPLTVYRGTNGGEIAGIDLSKAEGVILKNQGFVSTSMLPSTAFERKYSYQIAVPAGTKGALIRSISEYKEEQEFLLDRSMSLRILRVDKTGHKARIYAEVILSGK